MFTGIIQDVGEVVNVKSHSHALSLIIKTQFEPSSLELGASVACNGVCLTVTHLEKDVGGSLFHADVGPETLKACQFNSVKVGSKINLERAAKVGDALGGHILSGHVDGCAKVLSLIQTADGFWSLKVSLSAPLNKWVIEKGSIALAGISLTVAQLERNEKDATVECMIIPHTMENTTLKLYKAGMDVEVECDQMVKTIASVVESMIPQYLNQK